MRTSDDQSRRSEAYRYVRNAASLLDHGLVDLRRDALEVLERVLERVNPFEWCRQKLSIETDALTIGNLRLDLQHRSRIWFLGVGKASLQIARGVEDRLGDRLHGGLVICKEGETGSLQRIELLHASHPIPSATSVTAAKRMLQQVALVRTGDVVICAVTGGSSALMTLPCEGLGTEDLQELTKILLTCGADIFEINAVRKHASRVGGGRLAQAFAPGVHLVNLTVSDVTGDALDYITDPTVADTSTIADARATLDTYALWDRVPRAVRGFFEPGGAVTETPKQLPWPADHNILLLSAATAAEAAKDAATELGYEAVVLSSSFDGESQALAQVFAAIAREISLTGRPFRRPCALIGGGETIVQMSGFEGLGGPNQEFALAAALHLRSTGQVVVLAADTDGTDGPTQLAGGLCDSATFQHARKSGVDIRAALNQHRSTDALLRLGDAISTGATGSNVNDLKMMLIR
jgi:glycerate 2-kinase